MAVKIRLQRKGRKKAPFYHIVIADARSPRDGKYIERLGSYNPMTKPATIELDRDAAYNWLNNGAQPTDTVRAILRFKGVLVKKHLQRGVKKGALTQEEADLKLVQWIDAKENKIEERKQVTKKEQDNLRKAISGSAKIKTVEPEPIAEVLEVKDKVEEIVPIIENPEASEAIVEVNDVAEVVEPAIENIEPTAVADDTVVQSDEKTSAENENN